MVVMVERVDLIGFLARERLAAGAKWLKLLASTGPASLCLLFPGFSVIFLGFFKVIFRIMR